MLTSHCLLFVFVHAMSCFVRTHSQTINQHEQLQSSAADLLEMKHIPSVLHNGGVYLSVFYKCSSRRRISLSVRIERTLYRRNFAVFRRYWFCQPSTRLQTRYVRVRLHRSMAYAAGVQDDWLTWPTEHGQLNLIMYKNERENEQDILTHVQYPVRFLPAHQRPSMHSFRWHPLINQRINHVCQREPGKLLATLRLERME